MTPKALRELRAKLYDDMKKLHDGAKRNGGKLSERQQTDWDRMNSEYDGYTAKIERAERFDELEKLENERTGVMYENADDDDEGATLIGRNTGKDDGPRMQRWALRDSAESVYAIPKGLSTRSAINTLCRHNRDDEYAKMSFDDFARAIVAGPRNELERRALSEGTDSAGGFTVPSILLSQVVDALRSASRVFQAGATTLMFGTQSDTFTIARLATDPVASWHTENAVVAASDPTFEGITFTPRTLIALVRVSRELAADSANIAGMLSKAFAGALGSELDRVVLRGSGVAPEPKGVTLTTGVNSFSMGTNGAALTNFDPFVQVQELIETDDVLEPTTGIIMHPRDASVLARLKDTTNQPLRKPQALDGIPILSTTNLLINETQGTSGNASRAVMGHWPSVIVGIRSTLEIRILKERYADNNQLGFVASMRADIGLTHGQALGMIVGITP